MFHRETIRGKQTLCQPRVRTRGLAASQRPPCGAPTPAGSGEPPNQRDQAGNGDCPKTVLFKPYLKQNINVRTVVIIVTCGVYYFYRLMVIVPPGVYVSFYV